MFRWCEKTIEIITFRILIKNKSTITCSDIKKKNSGTISEGHSHFNAGLVTSVGETYFPGCRMICGGENRRATEKATPADTHASSFTFTPRLVRFSYYWRFVGLQRSTESKIKEVCSRLQSNSDSVGGYKSGDSPTIEISRCLLYGLRKCFRRAE